ncbi:MAG: hypothetical protein HRT88_23175, partial [Lentisphaeraceae bacterium]|nr:hypothetical protein [Lentisphaeraceae bacterium]
MSLSLTVAFSLLLSCGEENKNQAAEYDAPAVSDYQGGETPAAQDKVYPTSISAAVTSALVSDAHVDLNTAAAIFEQKCFSCHGGAGSESEEPFVNDAKALVDYKEELVARLFEDEDMPPLKFKPKYERKYKVTKSQLTHMQLTSAERAVLQKWFKQGMPRFVDFSSKKKAQLPVVVTEKVVVANQAPLTSDELEGHIVKIFDKKCSECHVARTTASSSRARQKGTRKWRGVDFMKALVSRQFDPSEKDFTKQDLYYTLKEDMPPKNAKHGGFTKAEWQLVENWIKVGAPVKKSTVQPIDIDRVYNAILKDLHQIVDTRRKHVRYFTLTNLYNTPGEAASLDLYRFALAKLINSISTGSRLVVPQVVAGTKETVYKIDIRDLKWSETLWDE